MRRRVAYCVMQGRQAGKLQKHLLHRICCVCSRAALACCHSFMLSARNIWCAADDQGLHVFTDADGMTGLADRVRTV